MLRLFLLLSLLSGPVFADVFPFSSMEIEVPIVVREPASFGPPGQRIGAAAVVKKIVNNKTFLGESRENAWYIGDIIAVKSQGENAGIIGFVEIKKVENVGSGKFEFSCELLRQSRNNMIQVGDQLLHLDLSSSNENYRGTTDLIVKESDRNISSKYRPLYTQGLSVGETAETLWENEYLLTWYGQLNYGLARHTTISTVLPADFFRAWNASFKTQWYHSYSNVFSTGFNFAKIPNSTQATLNMNLYWDSLSSESVVSHTLLSVALFSYDSAQDATAIKSLGTSSFQTGYEFILSNWDRVLMGPSYNFQKKAVGGYISYLKVFDKFHVSFSLNSTDVASFKLSPVDGYYFLFDAYWRF